MAYWVSQPQQQTDALPNYRLHIANKRMEESCQMGMQNGLSMQVDEQSRQQQTCMQDESIRHGVSPQIFPLSSRTNSQNALLEEGRRCKKELLHSIPH